jgi:hypothetical protein
MRSAASERVFELDKFLRETVGLNAGQIDSVHRGKAVAIVLDSPTPDEVFVFGTVYVKATPESYLRFANDFDALRKLPSYLAVQKFSNPPQRSDLEGFTNAEIGDVLGLSLDTVKIRLQRARRRLKKSMDHACHLYRDGRNEFSCDRNSATLKFKKI